MVSFSCNLKGVACKNFSGGKPQDPHFLSHKNQVKLDTAADKRCIEIELHKLILFNTFREGGDTIKDHFPFIHIFQKLQGMMLYRPC